MEFCFWAALWLLAAVINCFAIGFVNDEVTGEDLLISALGPFTLGIMVVIAILACFVEFCARMEKRVLWKKKPH